MDEMRKVNINRQSNVGSQAQERVYEAAAPEPRRGGSFMKMLVLALVLLAVVYGLVRFDVIALGGGSNGKYEAVFLVNGQVYFGKLSNEGRQFLTLSDVYYLQVSQPLQPATGSEQQTPNISLVQLGGELHGPTNAMRINRDQVLLIEDLKSDSNVVRAIEEYKKGAANTAPAAPAKN